MIELSRTVLQLAVAQRMKVHPAARRVRGVAVFEHLVATAAGARESRDLIQAAIDGL